jgi:hypothetical protein
MNTVQLLAVFSMVENTLSQMPCGTIHSLANRVMQNSCKGTTSASVCACSTCRKHDGRKDRVDPEILLRIEVHIRLLVTQHEMDVGVLGDRPLTGSAGRGHGLLAALDKGPARCSDRNGAEHLVHKAHKRHPRPSRRAA